jgi:alpha-methylacyl-CoA racemase
MAGSADTPPSRGAAPAGRPSPGGSALPLAGVRIADLSRVLAGPYCTMVLADLGADVIKVERPESGDETRAWGPPFAGGEAAYYLSVNRGKRSCALDMSRPEGREIALELCARADAVIENFKVGGAERLGVGYERVREHNPRVVYCSITGFGLGGRHEQRAGHDLNYLGWAGVLEDTAPGLPPVQAADLAAGALGAVVRILAALVERERTGRGTHLTVSMTHGSHDLVSHRLGGEPLPRLLTGGLACYRMYGTADGRHLTVGALEPKFFARLCEVVGRPELAERQYGPEQEALAAELAAIFAARPLAEWLEVFDGEDVCVGPVATRDEAATEFGGEPVGSTSELGEHTAAWRRELGV